MVGVVGSSPIAPTNSSRNRRTWRKREVLFSWRSAIQERLLLARGARAVVSRRGCAVALYFLGSGIGLSPDGISPAFRAAEALAFRSVLAAAFSSLVAALAVPFDLFMVSR